MSGIENVNVMPVSWLLTDPPVPCPDIMTDMDVAMYLRIWKKATTPGEQERIDRRCRMFIASLVQAGELPCFMASMQRRFRRSDVEDMVRLRLRTPGWRERVKERNAKFAARPKRAGVRVAKPYRNRTMAQINEDSIPEQVAEGGAA